jgi:hypothetical protein
MATITKNRYFFKWPKLLYFKPECGKKNVTEKHGIYVKLLIAM